MNTMIEDGKGSSRTAEVNSDNQLITKSIIEDQSLYNTHYGRTFILTTDFISITDTSSFHGILYFKNITDSDLQLAKIQICSNVSVSQWKFIKNPTAGTLISNGTVITPQNALFSSNIKFSGIATVGGQGFTVTDGILFAQEQCEIGMCNSEVSGNIILRNGNSFAMMVKVPASGQICSAIVIYFDKTD